MFNFFKKKAAKKKVLSEVRNEKEEANVAQPENTRDNQYIADQPITGKAEDRFNRSPFASRIAETIATRVDPSSIVIGLFGPWGDGKTSVLEMMQETLVPHANVIVVRFNPWHFQNEDLLLRGFFATLAESMGKSLPNMKEKAGELLKKYGSVLSLASLTVSGIIELSPGETVKGFGESMSNVGLDELRKRIELMLDEAKKRLVILIDDIDRLDREETHAIFKLVKLSASFRHTSYVLAFDDVVVSAALGERYGAGGAEAGRAFLEKIIQVPLHLPPADENSLRQIALEGIQNALNQAGIELTQPQVDAFIRHFDDALLSQLETPRRAKLLSNALMFALPILKNEVNPVDLMLIEGIRIIYPDLYTGIRENSELFLRGENDGYRQNRQETLSRINNLIESAISNLTADERETVKTRLLEPLFPRIGRSIYGNEWDEDWAKEQKVASRQYFKRYFTYSVPFGDVPDAQIAELCEAVPFASDPERRCLLEAFAIRHALPRVITRLRQREDSMTQEQASALITTFALNGDLLPRERGMMIVADTRAKAGMLIAGLLRQIPTGASRQTEAERLVHSAMPVGFALECFRWIRHYENKSEEKRVLTDEGEVPLKAILTNRIEEANRESPLFVIYPKDSPSLYWAWVDGTSMSHVRGILESHFSSEPEHLDDFLACYVGEAWGVESGLPRPADFSRNQYDSICSLISAEFIVENFRLRYGTELETPQDYPSEAMAQPRRIAHQFMSIHLHVIQEETTSTPN
ncbi:NTPase KAP [Pseudomonas chlororaphis]|uniref:KAP family P-loop NTPase fold protein n=1 Tax=Pseudomonas chlororaphis TaxID=587753 RepID=UPI0012325997|nr:P-loop NTPase fold protein [Pseudomonas chlororaphis]KAA5845894.1 NTPase KAP [Pseudomonas chlororaphis]